MTSCVSHATGRIQQLREFMDLIKNETQLTAILH